MSIESLAIKITAANLTGNVLSSLEGRMKGLANASEEVKKNFRDTIKFAKISATAGLATAGLSKGLIKARAHSGNLEESILNYTKESIKAGQSTKDLADETERLSKMALQVQKSVDTDITGVIDIGTVLKKSGIGFESLAAGALQLGAELASVEEVAPEVAAGIISVGDSFFDLEKRSIELGESDAFKNWGNAVSKATSLAKTGVEEINESLGSLSGSTVQDLKLNEKQLAVSLAALAKGNLTGGRGGTALGSFGRQLLTNKDLAGLSYDKGEFVGFDKAIENLREKLDSFKSTQEKANFVQKAFGDEGKKAISPLLKFYGDFTNKFDDMATIQDKVAVKMSGSNAKISSLTGTGSSALARMFLPFNDAIKIPIEKLTEFTELLADATSDDNDLGKVVSGASAGALATGAAVTVGAGLLAVIKGKSVLKATGGLKGLISGAGGTAAGIAKGKAVEAATGVNPVFVTNFGDMPSNMPSVPGVPGIPKSIPSWSASALSKVGGVGAVGAGVALAAITATAATGYQVYKASQNLDENEGLENYYADNPEQISSVVLENQKLIREYFKTGANGDLVRSSFGIQGTTGSSFLKDQEEYIKEILQEASEKAYDRETKGLVLAKAETSNGTNSGKKGFFDEDGFFENNIEIKVDQAGKVMVDAGNSNTNVNAELTPQLD